MSGFIYSQHACRCDERMRSSDFINGNLYLDLVSVFAVLVEEDVGQLDGQFFSSNLLFDRFEDGQLEHPDLLAAGGAPCAPVPLSEPIFCTLVRVIAVANTARENMFCAVHVVSFLTGGVTESHPALTLAFHVLASLSPYAIVTLRLLNGFGYPIWVTHVKHSIANMLLSKFELNMKESSFCVASSEVQHDVISFISAADEGPWGETDERSTFSIEMV